jgi:hypothetical protein
MNNQHDGGPAYPTTDGAMFETQADGNSIYRVAPGCNGMSLRDYFAAAALQAITPEPNPFSGGEFDYPLRAFRAYRMADAMLKARDYYER